jgi:hypothetical protein
MSRPVRLLGKELRLDVLQLMASSGLAMYVVTAAHA